MNPTDARDTIVKEIAIKVPADRIFEALTNPEQRLKWWGADGPLDALGSDQREFARPPSGLASGPGLVAGICRVDWVRESGAGRLTRLEDVYRPAKFRRVFA
jgi:hypothetical protein